MRRRFPIQHSPQELQVRQSLRDQKEATLQAILSEIPQKSCTFAEIADLIGYSYDWVRERLVKEPERLYKIGRRYRVPRAVAVEFVRSVFI